MGPGYGSDVFGAVVADGVLKGYAGTLGIPTGLSRRTGLRLPVDPCKPLLPAFFQGFVVEVGPDQIERAAIEAILGVSAWNLTDSRTIALASIAATEAFGYPFLSYDFDMWA